MRNDDPFSDLLRSLEERFEKEQGQEPPPPRLGNTPIQPVNPRRFLLPLVLFLLFILVTRSFGFLTDWQWYDSIGYRSVFFTRYTAWSQMLMVGFVVFWVFFLINAVLARRLERFGLSGSPVEQITDALGIRVAQLVMYVSVILAILMGLNAAGHWEEARLFLNQSDFGMSDKLFSRDVSFFIFTLPFWQSVRGWLTLTVIITLVGSAVINGLFWRGWQIGRGALIHLSVLVALLLLLFAWQYRLNAFELVYSQLGVVFGVGYTDANARLPIYNLLAIVSLVAAFIVVIVAAMRRGLLTIVAVIGVWILLAILAGSVYPGLVQRFRVSPNELNLERPYIANNIEFTRRAFDLDQIDVRPYEAGRSLTAADLVGEAETVRNIRLWDYRPLLQTYNQVQALTQYFRFNDVDIDRYRVGDRRQQVMLAARELDANQLPDTAQTWVNRKLVYTHGYGVVMSSVAEVSSDGLPQFLLKDLPQQGIITVTQPQIYFGELTNDYVIVRTNQPEFDYASKEGNVTTRFASENGIRLSFWNRLLFTINFGDINLLLNGDIQSDSRLLWRRSILDRVQRVAPFLRYDTDPYVVIGEDGRLYWVIDAYTVSDRFPYSEPLGNINYIRNPIKVITSAYDGTMTFYRIDESEPIAAAYARLFPSLFRPGSEMPEFVKAHLRYPEDLFSAQSEVYRTYHITDPEQFYNKEDVWAWPEEIFAGEPQRIEPYYVLMQLPDSNDLEYVLILPFTPANRENMIAWLAAHNDVARYGEKVVFEFGKETLFFGPKQVEARIDQDPTISSQLTLWNQQGSQVIRGNLIVLPIAGSLLYIEPIYLQAANGKIPELKRVVLATADRVVMADNLGLALVDFFGNQVLADPQLAGLAGSAEAARNRARQPAVDIGEAATDLSQVSLADLVLRANQIYEQMQKASQSGDWAGYGEQLSALQATLEQLAEVTGVQAPAAQPTPASEPAPVQESTVVTP